MNRLKIGIVTGFESFKAFTLLNPFKSWGQLYHDILRYFTPLNPGFSGRYRIPQVVLTGEFDIRLSFSTTSTEATEVLIGREDSSNDFIYIASDNTLRIRLAGGTYHSFGVLGTPKDGENHTVRMSRDAASVITASLDGIPYPDTVNESSTATFNAFCTWGLSLFFKGILSDVLIWDEGTLICNYKIDEDFAITDVLVDSATELGTQLYDHTKASNITSTVTVNNDGSITSSGNVVGVVEFGVDHGLSNGDKVLVEFTSFGMSGLSTVGLASTSLFSGLSSSERFIVGDGQYRKLLTVQDETLPIKFGFSSSAGTISNISIQEAPTYGQAINITKSDPYWLVDNEESWLGDLIGPFDDYVATGLESALSVIQSETGPDAGNLVRYTAKVAGLTSGSFNLIVGTSTRGFAVDGEYGDDVLVSSSQLLTQMGSQAANAGATLTASAKHLIPIAYDPTPPSADDIGAEEIGEGGDTTPAPPRNLRLTEINDA